MFDTKGSYSISSPLTKSQSLTRHSSRDRSKFETYRAKHIQCVLGKKHVSGTKTHAVWKIYIEVCAYKLIGDGASGFSVQRLQYQSPTSDFSD